MGDVVNTADLKISYIKGLLSVLFDAGMHESPKLVFPFPCHLRNDISIIKMVDTKKSVLAIDENNNPHLLWNFSLFEINHLRDFIYKNLI